MHTTYQYHSGWFPVIGLKFDKFVDLVLAFFTLVVIITILGVALASSRRIVKKVIKYLGLISLGIAIHSGIIIAEISIMVFHTIQRIPLSWYLITALTVIPMATDIPRQGMAWFLLAYCISNGWVVVNGVLSPPVSPPKTDQHTATSANKLVQQYQERPADRIQSHLFSGMRISIE